MAGSRTGRTQWARGRTTAGAARFGSARERLGAGAGTDGVGETDILNSSGKWAGNGS